MCAGAGYKSYKYKITVNVEANGKTYSGSTVQKLTTINGPSSSLGTGSSATRKGEAVVVNVDGKYLFLLWNYSIDDDSNYQNDGKPWQVSDVWERWNSGYKYPFATFTDINDPLTVKKVTPENIEQYFGEGAKITSIEVQRTFKPVTYGQVEKVIPWIRDGMRKNGVRKYPMFASDIKNYNLDTYYSHLSVADFILE